MVTLSEEAVHNLLSLNFYPANDTEVLQLYIQNGLRHLWGWFSESNFKGLCYQGDGRVSLWFVSADDVRHKAHM